MSRHIDIPRSGNPLAIAAILPGSLIPLSHAKGASLLFVIVVCVGMAILFAFLLKYGFYMRRTPLMRVDEASLTFFGKARSEQRSFQRRAISRITLFRRPDFWRSSFRLAVVVDAITVDLWVPGSSVRSVSTLAQALREQFPDKFEEIGA